MEKHSLEFYPLGGSPFALAEFASSSNGEIHLFAVSCPLCLAHKSGKLGSLAVIFCSAQYAR